MELKADLDEKTSQEGNCPQFKLNLNPRLAFKDTHNSTNICHKLINGSTSTSVTQRKTDRND